MAYLAEFQPLETMPAPMDYPDRLFLSVPQNDLTYNLGRLATPRLPDFNQFRS